MKPQSQNNVILFFPTQTKYPNSVCNLFKPPLDVQPTGQEHNASDPPLKAADQTIPAEVSTGNFKTSRNQNFFDK